MSDRRGVARTVLHLELGEPTLGIWCPSCALPSGVTAPILLLTERGVSHIGTYNRCMDCGRPIPVSP